MYVKLFESFLDSTVWLEADNVIRVFLTFLLSADLDGVVNMPIPALTRRANVTLDECRDAISRLEAPDPDSRTKDEEGRRIVRLDEEEPIWLVVNYEKYRALKDAETRKAHHARYMKEWRARKKRKSESNDVSQRETPVKVGEGGETMQKQKQKQKQRDNTLSAKADDLGDLLTYLIDIWNDEAEKVELPQVQPSAILKSTTQAGEKRRRTARKRLEEHPDLSEWEVVIQRVCAREYCQGKNDSGWRATFDYLTRVETFDNHWSGKFSKEKLRQGRFDPNSAKRKGEEF